MNRKEFFAASAKVGAGCCALALFGAAKADSPPLKPEDPNYVPPEKEWVTGWLNDLFTGLDAELDQETKVKVMAYCGRGCVTRYGFKQDIIRRGKNSLENLLAAYQKNFEIWREGDVVHLRYGTGPRECSCKAAAYHDVRPQDLHCECTRATHQFVFEQALGRPVKMDIVESVRRGGKTCHFIAHIAEKA